VFGASLWIALLKHTGFVGVYTVAATVMLVYALLTLRLRHWSMTP